MDWTHELLGAGLILVVSGRDSPPDIQAALEAGGDDFLSKPLSSDKLKECLRVLHGESELSAYE